VDFDANNNADKNMDDLILKAAIWQDDHWVDRSSMLKAPESAANELSGAVKVVMLSLDRNRESFVATYARYSTNPLPLFSLVRLKARSRQLPAASEKDLASLLAMAI